MSEDVRQKGIVVEANGKRATVRFKKTDACGHCNACFRFGSNEADIEMDNTLGAKKGDEVYIDMHANTVLKASAIVYGIPIIGLILGVAAGSRFGEIYAAIGGVALSGLSFLILKKLEPKFAKMNEFKPRMTAFVNEEGKEKKRINTKGGRTMVKHLTSADFEAAINASRPVLVDFWASWCGPCRMIGPVIEELSEDYDGRADICKVNVDDEIDLAKRFRIMSIPCVILFKDGQEMNRLVGARDKEEYADAIDEIMG